MIVKFKYCTVDWRPEDRLVVTRFPDGTEAHACPHETPEYHAHAIEKTGHDNVDLYAWQHDLFHVIAAQMRGGQSCVLWNLAHGVPTTDIWCEREEREAQDLQRALQIPLNGGQETNYTLG